MPLTSASPLTSRSATVFDFLTALARRHLASRVGLRGAIQVLTPAPGVFTLVHQYREACGSDLVEDRIAQLRAVACGRDAYRLFWKNGNGRWTAYAAPSGEPLVASIDECLSIVARDPHGCYWS
jgi:Protein of unknown function (DUF3024)